MIISKHRFMLPLIMLLLSVGCSFTMAQDNNRPAITFTKQSYDFGTVSEKDGDITCEFTFTNTGQSPLLIIRAQASCGCTSPEYPKKPLRPGEQGTVQVTYHTKGRPGPFQKSIYVYDNSQPNHKTMLTITGNVLSNRLPEENFMHQLGGGLRLKTRTVNFFDVYPTRANRTRTMQVYNESDEPIRLSFRNVPKYVYVESVDDFIEPKKEGQVAVTFLADKVKDWGMCKTHFEILVKGKEVQMKENRIAVTADVWEDFDNLSKRARKQAPEVDVEGTSLDFGAGTQPRTLTVVISNTGKSKMYVRKIQNDLPHVFATRLESTVVKPGAKTSLHITFQPDETTLQRINHHLTIITNDPTNSRVIVNMTAEK